MSKVQINCFLSPEGATRLKTLAKQQHQSYGDVLNGLLLELPLPESPDGLSALAALEHRLSMVESAIVPQQTLSPLATDSKQVYARLSPEDQATWKQRIRELRTQSVSYQGIAKQVYQEGITGQDGLPLSSSTIKSIITPKR